MANEKRLIDANALDAKLDELMKRYATQGRKEVAEDYNFVRTVLLTAPTVDAVEVVHAKWEYIPIIDSLGRYRCERCFHYVDAGTDRNYCPNCGAKMDRERREGE